MYLYPDNLRAKATLWLWELRDIAVIGIGGILAAAAAAKLHFLLPAVLLTVYAFLAIRFEDTSILDFLRSACAFFLVKQQYFEWGFASECGKKSRVRTEKEKRRASSLTPKQSQDTACSPKAARKLRTF